LAGLKALNPYVDGEIAVVGEDGVTSFAELQARPGLPLFEGHSTGRIRG
jgi:hypothetical protein